MRITELLKKESIELGVKVADKNAAIDKLISLMDAGGRLNSTQGYKEGILAREALGSTAIGEGIAIPHAKVEAVKEPGLAAMVVPEGVDYEAFDGSLANLIFMIAAPAAGDDVHLQALSRLSTLLMNPGFKESLIAAKDTDEFLDIIDKAENERFGEEEKKTEAAAENVTEDKAVEQKADDGAEKSASAVNAHYRVLAVTACPTGIAHTYMAAENLENTGKKLGISLKAETDGSGGAQNVLTKEEIAAAEAIIVAADKNVEMARFDGKPVIMVPVADGIHKAEALINQAVSGTVPVYHYSGDASGAASEGENDSVGRQIYKHLMNGVSHMLPFVIGGGILIALAFLLDDYSIDPSNFGKNTPLAAYLKTIGEQAFGMMLPILAGFIAMSIADRPGLAVGFVGGAIAANGTSGFLGALVAGFLAGYIVLLLKKICSKMPESLEGMKPMLIYPVLGIFITGVIMTYVVEPPIGALNTLINNGLNGLNGASAILLGALLGGMMSVDMGGPVNKAAYVFGTASIAAGNYNIMAAVMVGGMVPPIAIAIATLVFKNKFTAEERKAGPTNFVMGLSFITEGAIPFAASDPLHVLPSCMVGSAVAGALSMAFNCTLMAPHGGIFVFPTVGNPFMYLVALAIGSVVSAVLLGVLKKNVA